MVLEIALFRVRAGVTDEQVLAVSAALQQELLPLEGYLGRQLGKTADGQWADVVRWTSQEAAQRAAQALESRACLQEFARIEAPGSEQILYLQPVKAYPGGEAPGVAVAAGSGRAAA